MQQRSLAKPTSAAWRAGLQRLGAWVLDQPLTPLLEGQCCDRLRPAQIGRDLTRALARHGLAGCTVVEWRWDQRRERAEGWLWSNGLLQRFRWQRQGDQLELRDQLQCTNRLRPLGALQGRLKVCPARPWRPRRHLVCSQGQPLCDAPERLSQR